MGLDVKSLVLPDSVVYIGRNAFSEYIFSRNTICSIKLPQDLKELTAESALCGLELKIRASIIIGFNNNERFSKQRH